MTEKMSEAKGEVVIYRPDDVEDQMAPVRSKVERLLVAVEKLVVDDVPSFEKAGEVVRRSKERAAALDNDRRSITDPIRLAEKNANAMFQPAIKGYREAASICTDKMGDWERQEAEAARLREEEIRQQQEEEHAEQKKKAEEAAAKAEERGDAEAAADHMQAAQMPLIPVAVMPRKATKLEGLNRRQTWKARVVDLEAVPMTYCKKVPLMEVLHAEARRTEGAGHVPGVEFYPDTEYAKA